MIPGADQIDTRLVVLEADPQHGAESGDSALIIRVSYLTSIWEGTSASGKKAVTVH
jgi:hypothetical protein